MKQASIFKSSRSLMIGMLATLLPLSAIHAADAQVEPNWQRQGPAETLPSGSQDSGTPSGQSTEESIPPTEPRGVQGPIRSNVTGNESPSGESSESIEMQERRDQEERDREADERRRHVPPPNILPDTGGIPPGGTMTPGTSTP